MKKYWRSVEYDLSSLEKCFKKNPNAWFAAWILVSALLYDFWRLVCEGVFTALKPSMHTDECLINTDSELRAQIQQKHVLED